MTSLSTKPLAYVRELDGLRAVACLLVMCFHAAPGWLFKGGFIGVDIFFVLSGYLITCVLMDEYEQRGEIAIGNFYAHRFLRLVPALALFLLCYVIIGSLVWPGEPHLRDAGMAAAYISDYTYPYWGSPNYIRHTWSLAVEEQFYIVWPFFLPLIIRYKLARWALLALWAVVTIYRYSLADGDWIEYYFPLHTRLSGLLAGSMLAIAHRKGILKLNRISSDVALAGLFITALRANITSSAFTISLAELMSLILVGVLVSSSDPSRATILSSKPMVAIGKLSYGLYLWHFPFAYYFRENYSPVVSTIATISLSMIGATISYFTVEAWGRKFKAQLKKRTGTKYDAELGVNSPAASPL